MQRRMRGTSPVVEQMAVQNRKEPTTQEALLWQALRNGRLDGVKFRRQYPLQRFILDFYCAEYGLVIELDGSIHEQQQERDEERDAILAAHGFTVLRISNDEIDHSLPAALDRIRQTIQSLQK